MGNPLFFPVDIYIFGLCRSPSLTHDIISRSLTKVLLKLMLSNDDNNSDGGDDDARDADHNRPYIVTKSTDHKSVGNTSLVRVPIFFFYYTPRN